MSEGRNEKFQEASLASPEKGKKEEIRQVSSSIFFFSYTTPREPFPPYISFLEQVSRRCAPSRQ